MNIIDRKQIHTSKRVMNEFSYKAKPYKRLKANFKMPFVCISLIYICAVSGSHKINTPVIGLLIEHYSNTILDLLFHLQFK